MCLHSRRSLLAIIGAAVAAFTTRAASAAMSEHQQFINAAFQMKAVAVELGDQAYGAVVVRHQKIVGFGPSRVVLTNDQNAHAERVAIRDAQTHLGEDLF